MTSKEILEKYCNEIVYNYLTLPSYQNEIEASGIDFKYLASSGIISADVAVNYQVKRKTQSHELALSELSNELTYIERVMDSAPLSYLPLKSDLIREKFKELYSAFELDELSKKVQLAKTPEHKKRILESMQSKCLGGVEATTLTDIAIAFLPELYEKSKTGEAKKIINGFPILSNMIGGFNGKRIAILQAATGYGKTVFGLNLALKAAETMAVSYVNMEMAFEDILRRVAVITMGIRYDQFYKAEFKLDEAINEIAKIGDKFSLTSGRSLNINAISAWVRQQKHSMGTQFIIIDYDQKIDHGDSMKDEWRLMQSALLQLEELAKELDIYVLVLAQVNRNNQISSSFRATYSAHTVLHFYEHETHGAVVSAIKNRHGKRNQAVALNYDSERSKILEKGLVDLGDSDKPKLNFKKTEMRVPYADN